MASVPSDEAIAWSLQGRRSSSRARKVVSYNDDVDIGLDHAEIVAFEERLTERNAKRKKPIKLEEDDEVFEVDITTVEDEHEHKLLTTQPLTCHKEIHDEDDFVEMKPLKKRELKPLNKSPPPKQKTEPKIVKPTSPILNGEDEEVDIMEVETPPKPTKVVEKHDDSDDEDVVVTPKKRGKSLSIVDDEDLFGEENITKEEIRPTSNGRREEVVSKAYSVKPNTSTKKPSKRRRDDYEDEEEDSDFGGVGEDDEDDGDFGDDSDEDFGKKNSKNGKPTKKPKVPPKEAKKKALARKMNETIESKPFQPDPKPTVNGTKESIRLSPSPPNLNPKPKANNTNETKPSLSPPNPKAHSITPSSLPSSSRSTHTASLSSNPATPLSPSPIAPSPLLSTSLPPSKEKPPTTKPIPPTTKLIPPTAAPTTTPTTTTTPTPTPASTPKPTPTPKQDKPTPPKEKEEKPTPPTQKQEKPTPPKQKEEKPTPPKQKEEKPTPPKQKEEKPAISKVDKPAPKPPAPKPTATNPTLSSSPKFKPPFSKSSSPSSPAKEGGGLAALIAKTGSLPVKRRVGLSTKVKSLHPK